MSAEEDSLKSTSSFLGTGWSFPPTFVTDGAPEGQVLMSSGVDDIEASLRILFSTTLGERFLNPEYGLDLRDLLFEPASTTMRTFLRDQIQTSILVYEARIDILSLEVDSPNPFEGQLRIVLSYAVRATNSRYNLVFPFYRTDGNEVRGLAPPPPR